MLGLPPIDGNLAEGLVLKPDAALPPSRRPVYKRKIATFDEAGRWDPGRLDVEALRGWVDLLVNDARVASARSKVGTDPALVVEEVALDVAIDLEEVFAEAWASVDQEAVLAYARTRAREVARRS